MNKYVKTGFILLGLAIVGAMFGGGKEENKNSLAGNVYEFNRVFKEGEKHRISFYENDGNLNCRLYGKLGERWEGLLEGPVQIHRQTARLRSAKGDTYIVGVAACFDFDQGKSFAPEYLDEDIETTIRSDQFRRYAAMSWREKQTTPICRRDMPSIALIRDPIYVADVPGYGPLRLDLEAMAREYMRWCATTKYRVWNFRLLQDGTIAINHYDDGSNGRSEYVGRIVR